MLELCGMDVYYLYILQSETSGNFYVGYTTNPHRRLVEHNTIAHNTFTSKGRPWSLKAVFYIGEDEGLAVKVERFIKGQHSMKLIERLIDTDFVPNGRLAHLIRVPHVRD